MKKKLLSFIILFCMLFTSAIALVGCGKNPPDEGGGASAYSEHKEFNAMVENIITSFNVEDEPQAQGVLPNYPSATYVSSGASGSEKDDLFLSLTEKLNETAKTEQKQAQTWFKAMCKSIFSFPLGTSDALENTFKEKKLYDTVIGVWDFNDYDNPSLDNITMQFMTIKSLSNTTKVIYIVDNEGFVRCELNYKSEGDFSFEYIDVAFEIGDTLEVKEVDYCYGDSRQNVIEVFTDFEDYASATWFNGITCYEFGVNGGTNAVILDCIEEVLLAKEPSQYRSEALSIFGSFDYKISMDDLYSHMDKYLEDVYEEMENARDPFEGGIANGCLYHIPDDFADETLIMPSNITGFEYGLRIPECVKKIIIPDNVQKIYLQAGHVNHYLAQIGKQPIYPENNMVGEWAEASADYLDYFGTSLFEVYRAGGAPLGGYEGEILVSATSPIIRLDPLGTFININETYEQDSEKDWFLVHYNKRALDKVASSLIPENFTINTNDFDFTVKGENKYNLQLEAYMSNGYCIPMQDGDLNRFWAEDTILYNAQGQEFLKYVAAEKKLYMKNSGSWTWIYDYSGSTVASNHDFIIDTLGLSPISFIEVIIEKPHPDGGGNPNITASYSMKYGTNMLILGYTEYQDQFPAIVYADARTFEIKDESGTKYSIYSGAIELHNGKAYKWEENGSAWERTYTDRETFHYKMNYEAFQEFIFSQLDINTINFIKHHMMQNINFSSYIKNITINSDENNCTFDFLFSAQYTSNATIESITINSSFSGDEHTTINISLPNVYKVKTINISAISQFRMYTYGNLLVDALNISGNVKAITLEGIQMTGDTTLNIPESCESLKLDTSQENSFKVNGDLTINFSSDEIALEHTCKDDYDFTYSDFNIDFSKITGKVYLNTNLTIEELALGAEYMFDKDWETTPTNLSGLIAGLLIAPSSEFDSEKVIINTATGGAIICLDKVTGESIYDYALTVENYVEAINLTENIIHSIDTDAIFSKDSNGENVLNKSNITLSEGDNTIYVTIKDKNNVLEDVQYVINIYRKKHVTLTIVADDERCFDGELTKTVIEGDNLNVVLDTFTCPNGWEIDYNASFTMGGTKYTAYMDRRAVGGTDEHMYVVVIEEYVGEDITITVSASLIERTIYYSYQNPDDPNDTRSHQETFTCLTPAKNLSNIFPHFTVNGWYYYTDLTGESVTTIDFASATRDIFLYADGINHTFNINYELPDEFVKTDYDDMPEKVRLTGFDAAENIYIALADHSNDKVGYNFGLYWDEDGTQAVYSSDNLNFNNLLEKFDSVQEITFYGIFTPIEYTVTLMLSDVQDPVFYDDYNIQSTSSWDIFEFIYTIEDVIDLDKILDLTQMSDFTDLYTYDGWSVYGYDNPSFDPGTILYEIPLGTTGDIAFRLNFTTK